MTAAFERTGPEGLVVKRWPAPAPDPVRILGARLDGARPAVLRSGAGDPRLSRWSYGALEPVRQVTSWAAARAAMADWVGPSSRRMPPFVGGAIGYLGYDLGWAHTARPRPPRPDPLGLPNAAMSLYDAVYARDERTGEGWLVAQDHAEARRRLDRLERALATPTAVPAGRAEGLSPAVPRATHERRIREALGLIRDGEVYQVNLTYPLEGRFVGDSAAAFLRLVAGAPPPFAAYLDLGEDRALVSASPECFVRFDPWTRALSTYPIKGTRKRDRDPAQDRLHAEALRADPKERAEHLMIVDLLRNDLGRLAAPGDVAVDGLCYVESFETVHHLTSRVVATLPEGLPDAALLDAVFPGGSITGAPKLRAMEIIDALEGAPRGVYTGTIGYLAPDGAISTSIAIRTAQIAQGELRFGVGGGIVADSVPASEWDETQVKARALGAALRG